MGKVFRGTCLDVFNLPYHFIAEGEPTSTVLDGCAMVQVGNTLVPDEGFVATRAEAKEQIALALVRYVGRLQAEIDKLREQILHEALTTQEHAA